MSVHGLPSSTQIRKPVHKKLLYTKFPVELSGDKRKQFDEDIGRIVITNSKFKIRFRFRSRSSRYLYCR